MTRFNADSFRFDLPDSWDEITFGQSLAFMDGLNMVGTLCVLSGKTTDDFRPLRAPDLAAIVREHLAYLDTPPDFSALPVPMALNISGLSITPPKSIGADTTIGQKWDVDEAMQQITTEDDQFDLFAVAPTLLSIYLAPRITGLPYTDIEQAHAVLPAIHALPCTDALPLAAFFLSSYRQTTPSGRVSFSKLPPVTTGWPKRLPSLRRVLTRLIPSLPWKPSLSSTK